MIKKICDICEDEITGKNEMKDIDIYIKGKEVSDKHDSFADATLELNYSTLMKESHHCSDCLFDIIAEQFDKNKAMRA